MLNNGIANLLIHTNPVKKILLPLAQQRLSLPLPPPDFDYKYILKPSPFWCSNNCTSLMKCLKINNSSTKCLKGGSLINSIQSSTYNVFKITYNLKMSNYSYIGTLNSVIEVFGKVYLKENLERHHQEIDIILYSLKDMKLQDEYGFFLKTTDKIIFFRNDSMDINIIYTNIKLIDLDKMKNIIL
jgi:hypothetical protein